ncbi:reverse transcriptase domain-containing protein [Tanacetum coccineum]
MILGSLKKFKKRSPEKLKPQSKDTRRTSGNTTRNDPFPPFLLLEAQTQIMPPRMTTRSAGRATAAPRGGRTGGRTGRGGGRTRGLSGDQGNGRIDVQGGKEDGQGSKVNDGVDGVPDFSTVIAQQLQNFLPTIVAQIYIRGRDAAIGMSWENFKNLTREEFCPSNEMQKLETELWNHAMVRAGHATYTDRFHELARLVPHLVTPKNKRIERYIYGLALHILGMVAATEPMTIQKAV